MSYRVVIHPDLVPTCRKVRAKDPTRYEQAKKKVRLLTKNPKQASPCTRHLKGCGGSISDILFW
jgi:hypothetical protein